MRLESREVRKKRYRSGRRGLSLVRSTLHRYQTHVLVALGLFIMVVAGFVLAHSNLASEDNFRTELLNVGHQAVRDVIKEEFRTAFSGMEETDFEERADGKYVISGWVDLISEQGAIERQHFTCTLYQNDNGDWLSEDVSVTPQ